MGEEAWDRVKMTKCRVNMTKHIVYMCENVRYENPRSKGELPPNRLLASKTSDVPKISQLPQCWL